MLSLHMGPGLVPAVPLACPELDAVTADSQLTPGPNTQPGVGKPHPGTFCWPVTTARLINCCLCACLPGEKLLPPRQVARCQQTQSPLLLLSLFSSPAHSQPCLQQPQWPRAGGVGTQQHSSMVSRGRALGCVGDFPAELLTGGGGESVFMTDLLQSSNIF